MRKEKKEKEVYKKWWFWLIILGIVIVISFTAIMMVGYYLATSGIHEVARNVQSIDNEATLYSSAGGNTIIIEIPNYTDDAKKSKVEKIENLIKSYAQEGEILSNFSKCIICKEMPDEENYEKYFIATNIYTLPSMVEDTSSSNIYIDFVEFTRKSLDTTTSSNGNAESTQNGEDITLTAGKYTVGTDIKAGKYDAIAQSGKGNLFVKGTSYVNEMMGISDASYYIPRYSNITLKNGDTVEVTSSLKVLFQSK